MIHDSLAQSAERYYAIHPLFREALEYVSGHFDELLQPESNGKLVIKGDDIFAFIGDNDLKTKSDAALEAHNKYIDIQVMLAGTECFGWSQRIACQSPRAEFDPDNDFILFDDAPTSFVTAQPGEFVVFFPEDAHAPLIRPGSSAAHSRKAILKIKA